ncbi:MAG TPA: PSD1 and planctomycete cytochrome C domain-containing protein [Bryobacteraceae bacterium]|nr:PSD1 and planctomycete cytochrome C domain-containing protein [Bryobacteraceae bacterium]
MRHAICLIFVAAAYAQAPADIEFFDKEIRPLLRTNCQGCHSVNSLNSGLAMDSRDAIIKGGNRGAAAVAGDANSLLLQAVRQDGGLKMPPGRKLAPEQIAKLEDWVKRGLPVPQEFVAAKRRKSTHWAFQPVKRPEAAGVDELVQKKLKEKNLTPSPEADRVTLIRRVSLDLVGLPPTRQEVADFVADSRPDAYERLVDRLLASPHYGERQTRHWLDLARFADSDGYTIDAPRDIFPYRDWVLRALNDDMPFDQFTIEQFAGDLLPNATNDQIIATGFHRNTPSNYEGGIDFEQYRVEAVADRVQTTGAVWLGLTLGCARCHDHKYDPISQKEHYQLFAFLNNVDEVDKEADRKFFNKPFLELGSPEQVAALAKWDAAVQDVEFRIRKHQETLTQDADKDPKLIELRAELNTLRKNKPQVQRTLVMRELAKPREHYIHLGGDFTRKGSAVQPAVPAVFPPMKNPNAVPNRLDLAKWLVDKDNPVTARVTMNRIWQQYFGKGIVETENDFGLMGDRPTQPELLDWLASEFMAGGWKMKRMHKLIVMSATYRQASQARQDVTAVDPYNKFLARQNRLRLDAEIIRDSALTVTGLLSEKLGGPSVYPPIPKGANDVTQVKREWKVSEGEDKYRRGMYTFFQRSAAHPGLITFDAPDSTVTCTRRVRSNTPLQALILLNDDAYFEFAGALAKRVIQEGADKDDAGKLTLAWQQVLQRKPKASESQRMLAFLTAQRDAQKVKSEQAAWTAVGRVLLNLDEFMTRE